MVQEYKRTREQENIITRVYNNQGEQDAMELAAMQTILAPNIYIFFFADIYLFDANKIICFCFKEFPTPT